MFFGTCAVVQNEPDGSFVDLTKETWLKVYEKLFGGFETLGDEDDFSEDELENVDPALLTAHGYLKDGFVISDKETLESGEVSAEEEVPKKKKAIKKVSLKKKKEEEEAAEDTSELEEEVYTFSDDDETTFPKG